MFEIEFREKGILQTRQIVRSWTWTYSPKELVVTGQDTGCEVFWVTWLKTPIYGCFEVFGPLHSKAKPYVLKYLRSTQKAMKLPVKSHPPPPPLHFTSSITHKPASRSLKESRLLLLLILLLLLLLLWI